MMQVRRLDDVLAGNKEKVPKSSRTNSAKTRFPSLEKREPSSKIYVR